MKQLALLKIAYALNADVIEPRFVKSVYMIRIS